jgi:hypothetical protein
MVEAIVATISSSSTTTSRPTSNTSTSLETAGWGPSYRIVTPGANNSTDSLQAAASSALFALCIDSTAAHQKLMRTADFVDLCGSFILGTRACTADAMVPLLRLTIDLTSAEPDASDLLAAMGVPNQIRNLLRANANDGKARLRSNFVDLLLALAANLEHAPNRRRVTFASPVCDSRAFVSSVDRSNKIQGRGHRGGRGNGRWDGELATSTPSHQFRPPVASAMGTITAIPHLTESQLLGAVEMVTSELKQISRGKVKSERHDCYRKGGKARRTQMSNIRLGEVTEIQQETIMDRLIEVFPTSK